MAQTGIDGTHTDLPVEDEKSLIRLLDELPDAVIVIDAHGIVQWVNRTAGTLFGRPSADAIGVTGLDLVHPDDLEMVLLSLSSVQAKHVGSPIEIRLRTTGGWRLMELIGSPVGWFQPGAILLTVRDLTQRRRYEIVHDHDARLRSLVQNSAAITMLVSPDGCVQSVSGALTRVLGQDPEIVEGQPLSELVVDNDRPALDAAFERASRGASVAGPVKVLLSLVRHGNLATLPFELAIVNLIDDPTVGGYVVTGHDVSDQQLADLQLREALSLVRATLDATADGIMVVDNDDEIVSSNRRLSEMWGVPDAILESGNRRTVTEYIRDQLESPEQCAARVEAYEDPESESADLLRFKDGRVFERISKPQRIGPDVVGRVWSFRDITDRTRLEERLSHQAVHDSLTGLPNRVLFQDRLRHAVARGKRTGGNPAVLSIDVDGLSAVNDSHGQATGDGVLQSLAAVLTGCLRGSDSVARLGGDEFGIVLEHVSGVDAALMMAERLRDAIRRPLSVGDNQISVTASIGVAVATPGASGDQVLSNAVLALHTAKGLGGDRISEYAAGMPAPFFG
ncbi:MAG TPA: diguanylate cyclase [Acidimicrobiales bacterium]|nr:diguanylate cyclase [Acidimicrobiales bacterium]